LSIEFLFLPFCDTIRETGDEMGKPADKNRKPLYLEICDFVLQEIRDRKFEPNQKLISSEELQKKFTVSKITTEKAFKVLMERGIIYRIPGRGTFITDANTVHLSASPSTPKTIAFVTASLISHHVINILTGINDVLTIRGHKLRFCLANGSFERQEEIIRGLIADKIDGMIIYPVEGQYYDEEILRMKLSKFPFVLVDKRFTKIKTSYVISNNTEGAYRITKELLKKGHKRIAFISTYAPSSTSAIRDRVDGFQSAMNEAGILNTEDLVFQGFDDDVGIHLSTDPEHRKKLIEKIKTFLADNPGISAILTISPGNLSHVVRALRELDSSGAKRHEVELALFDLDEFLDFSRTAFLTINQRSREIGRRSAEILMEQITDPDRIQELVLDMDMANT